MDFDAILDDVGSFGRYQKLVIYLVVLPAVLPCGFHAYVQLFMAGETRHWCRVPELEGAIDQDLMKNLRYDHALLPKFICPRQDLVIHYFYAGTTLMIQHFEPSLQCLFG